MRRSSTMTGLMLFTTFSLAWLAPAATAQETITLETGLTVGRTIRYEVRQQYETVQMLGETETTLLVEQHALMDLVVESSDEAGNAVVRMEPLSYSARLVNAEGPVSISFDLERPRADGAERATGVLGLEQSLALAPLRATLRADGTVIRVTGLDEPMAMVQSLPDFEPNLVTFFDPERLSDVLSAIFSADGGIGERERGESWSTEKRLPLAGSGTLVAKTETTLSLVGDGEAGLAGVYSLTLEKPAVESDSVPRMDLNKSEGQIISGWDLDAGSLVRRTANLTVSMRVTLAEDNSVTTTAKSTTNITRLARPER